MTKLTTLDQAKKALEKDGFKTYFDEGDDCHCAEIQIIVCHHHYAVVTVVARFYKSQFSHSSGFFVSH